MYNVICSRKFGRGETRCELYNTLLNKKTEALTDGGAVDVWLLPPLDIWVTGLTGGGGEGESEGGDSFLLRRSSDDFFESFSDGGGEDIRFTADWSWLVDEFFVRSWLDELVDDGGDWAASDVGRGDNGAFELSNEGSL